MPAYLVIERAVADRLSSYSVRRYVVAAGLVFGACVMVVMIYGIVPLGHATRMHGTVAHLLNVLIAHTIFFGVPVAMTDAAVMKIGSVSAADFVAPGGFGTLSRGSEWLVERGSAGRSGLAQLVEQLTVNQRVVGSSPTSGAIEPLCNNRI